MDTTRQPSTWRSFDLPRFEKLGKSISVDVAVIGGGITGATAAYLLKKAGKKVALLERGRCGLGETGQTTGHLTHVTDLRLTDLVDGFGLEAARMVWDAGRAALEQISEIIRALAIPCEFTWASGYLHASLKDAHDETARLQQEAQLSNDLGFPATFLERVPIVERPGIRFQSQAKLHPLRYLSGLLQAIPGDGSHVFEESEAVEFTERPLSVKANGQVVSCDHVVLATHVPVMGNRNLAAAALLQSKLALHTTYVIGAKIPKNGATEGPFWDTTEPYYYLRIDALPDHDHVIFGGEDHKTGQVESTGERFESLKGTLARILPQARVDAQWSGQIVETNDGLPYIGEASDRQFVATGFGGNGLTFGTVAGMMARDAVLRVKNPWKALFDIHRVKLSGAWSYVRENLDYPYYLVRDRLKPAEGESFDDVKPGEAKILRLRGHRVAAYRAPDGKLSAVSAVCTHLGCIVRWNAAELTWDCPCHGSRFRPSGEVIGGPAEHPLEDRSGGLPGG